MLFISPQKLLSFSRYLSFSLDFLLMYWKDLIKKSNNNFKFYDVTFWLTNNLIHMLPNISRYLIFFLMFVCNNFLFHAFVTMVYWTSTEVSLNLVTPLDSSMPYLDFERINVIWTSSFDSVSIVFDWFSVSRSLPDLYFSHSI